MQPFASQNPLTPQSDSPQPPSLPAVPVPESVAAASQNPQPAASQAADTGLPELADDGDLIEKEWVNQAKHIMHSTAHDPYEQSKQFSSLRADYMQKRYGKAIAAED